MKTITVVTPCYNEEENVQQCYDKVKLIFSGLKEYHYEHMFIDNASTDTSLVLLKEIANNDSKVKIIENSRNFGHLKSPVHGLLQSTGDATILFVADMQDPAEMIPELIKKWEEGYKSVLGVKKSSEESGVMFFIRKMYYKLVNSLSEVKLIDNFYGFGLYDKEVISVLKDMEDPYPYFRGMIPEIGLDIAIVEFDQLVRRRGITKNNFYTLYDIGMLGIISHSKVPLRVATMSGFLFAVISVLIAFGYLVAKLLYWDTFDMGIAPIIIGLFLFGSIQLLFIGIIGEYIGFIFTKIQNRPLVIEKERVNFD